MSRKTGFEQGFDVGQGAQFATPRLRHAVLKERLALLRGGGHEPMVFAHTFNDGAQVQQPDEQSPLLFKIE